MRIAKAIKSYDERFSASRVGTFYLSDVYEVMTLAEQGRAEDYLINAIEAALRAGFLIGYRAAERKRRKAA